MSQAAAASEDLPPKGVRAGVGTVLGDAAAQAAVVSLLDSVRDYAMFLLTPQGHVASWNRGAEHIKGYGADEIIGQHFSFFYPPVALERDWPAHELVRAKEQGRFEDEGWRLRKDGSLFWANVVISAVLGSDGQLLGFLKVTRDLSDRREQQSRLEVSERNTRLLIASVQDYAIFQLDPAGIIISWNEGAERIKGYTASEAIGQHFSMFYPAQAVRTGWPQEELRRAQITGRFEDEGWRLRKDGSRFWANVVIATIRDEQGLLLGFSKVTRDLTERRNQEEALRKSEQGLRLLVEGARDHAMFLLALHGRVSSWNFGACRLLKYSEEQAQGLNLGSFLVADEKAVEQPSTTLNEALMTGFSERQGWWVRGDGSRIWCECSITLQNGPSNEPVGFVVLVRDLTQRRQVEKLRSEGARMTEFIATLSHELRNPLAPIRHAVEALKRRSVEPEVKRASQVIDRQVSLLTRLVDDLLDFSRAASGRMQLQMASLDLTSLVEAAAASSASLMASYKHKLRVSVSQVPVPVRGDVNRLTQVMSNLLTNAAKYTPPGGAVTLSLERTADGAKVELTDTGVGMTESLLQLAFEPFVQADRTLARSEGGMGIGLALVKRIVELHAGTVRLSSPGPGLGTTVTLQLPVDASGTVATGSHGVGDGTERFMELHQSMRILVVDDNVDAAESLASLLTDEGHEVKVVFDGYEALAAAADHEPQVVLLDVGLPGMNGLEVAAKIRVMPRGADVRLIAVTGYGQPSDIAATRAAGFDAHLTKPFGLDQLFKVLPLGREATSSPGCEHTRSDC